MHKRLLSLVAVAACLAAACGGTTTEAEHPQDNDASLPDAQTEASPDAGAQDTAPDMIVDDWTGTTDATDEPAPPDGDIPDGSKPDGEPADQATPDVVVVDSDGVSCGNTTCAPGLLCCASVTDGGASFECASECPEGGVPMACDGPEDCGGAQCCVQIDVGAGTLPNCPIQTNGATCKASCPTQIPMSCPGQGQGQLCHSSADCTDAQNPSCCTFSQGGVSATFCVNSLLGQFATSCN